MLEVFFYLMLFCGAVAFFAAIACSLRDLRKNYQDLPDDDVDRRPWD